MYLGRPLLFVLLPRLPLLPPRRHPAGRARHLRDGRGRHLRRNAGPRLPPGDGGQADAPHRTASAEQEQALDAAAAELVPRMLTAGGAATVRRDTLELAGTMERLHRLRKTPPTAGTYTALPTHMTTGCSATTSPPL